MAKLYAFGEASQVDRDVMVWNNKQYVLMVFEHVIVE